MARGGPPATLLIVSSAVGASPEKMLEMLTPPSASSPRPSLSRCWISAASLGWLATSSRPSSFSYQRNAGTCPLAPCSSPAWLAGVVDGSCTSQDVATWLPERTHRVRVGRSPLWIAHCSNGAGSPSTWMKTTPGVVEVVVAVRDLRDCRSRYDRNPVSSPALTSHVTTVISRE